MVRQFCSDLIDLIWLWNIEHQVYQNHNRNLDHYTEWTFILIMSVHSIARPENSRVNPTKNPTKTHTLWNYETSLLSDFATLDTTLGNLGHLRVVIPQCPGVSGV